MAQSDTELIQAYQQTADPALVGELYRRYTALVYGVCLKYLKDRDEAKDATMQLFEKLLTVLKDQEIIQFKSWLFVTARNHCLMQLRSNKGKFKVEFSDVSMENQLVLHLEEENGLETNLDKLAGCIERLLDGQKECVRLFYLQEKCYKEIAQITRFDLLQVKSFIQNGKRNLKICMEANG